jgi:hypothetical protein
MWLEKASLEGQRSFGQSVLLTAWLWLRCEANSLEPSVSRRHSAFSTDTERDTSILRDTSTIPAT